MRPPDDTRRTSPFRTPLSVARAGLISTTLPQVRVEKGFGNSCSQALLAKAPSHVLGSGRSRMSSPCPAGGPREGASPIWMSTGAAGSSTKPLGKTVFHLSSKPSPQASRQLSITNRRSEAPGRPCRTSSSTGIVRVS